MMAQLHQELAKKKEASAKLQAVVQETKRAKPPSIATIEANTMTQTTLVSSPSLDFSQEYFGKFEKHTNYQGHWFEIIKVDGLQWTRPKG